MRSRADLDLHRARVDAFIAALDDNKRGILATSIVGAIDEECAQQLRVGRRTIWGSIASVRLVFLEFLDKHGDRHGVSESDRADRPLVEALFQGTLHWLRDEGALVFSVDRLRCRGRVFEVVHYLRSLRQRTTKGEKDGSRPELVEMLKVEVRPRVRPIRMDKSAAEFVAAAELEYPDELLSCDEDYPLSDCYRRVADLFVRFIESAFPKGFQPARFQMESFRRLLQAGFVDDGNEEAPAFVIAAGTGFGKTEAFLFPLLFYAVYSKLAKIEGSQRGRGKPVGVDGLLLYPRRDLCDNQAERVLSYLFHINALLRDDLGGAFEPIRVALAHSNVGQLRIRCPMCAAEQRVAPEEWTPDDEQTAFIKAIPDEHRNWLVQGFRCERGRRRHDEVCSYLVYQTFGASEAADLVVTTLDTLNRRLMDTHGRARIFSQRYLPRFVVLDEMHIYEGQSGSHAANILRRCRQRIRYPTGLDGPAMGRPVFVGASATAGRPHETGARMFGVEADEITVVKPGLDEETKQGLEYFLFLRSPGNRLIRAHEEFTLDGNYEDDLESTRNTETRFVSEQASMIQAAFCLQHTMRTRGNKRRTLGFVDSIDVAQRLSGNLHDPEWSAFASETSSTLPLYAYRYPAGRTGLDEAHLMGVVQQAGKEFFGRDIAARPLPALGQNCPRRFLGTCSQPPHYLLDPCRRYEEGECWWTMGEPGEEGLQPMLVQMRRSAYQAWGEVGRRFLPEDRDRWRLLVATSTLEVGFDHDELIATWQYHAPPSVASFVQRKGRGGRGLRDFPITLVVLGPSGDDAYFFQNHLRLVDVSESDIVSYVDHENPSLRSQHVVAAIYDLCASDKNTGDEVFKGLDFQTVLSLLDEANGWVSEVYPDMAPEDIDSVIKRYREYVNYVLDDQLVPLAPAGEVAPSTLRPVDLFRMKRDKVTQYNTLIGEKLAVAGPPDKPALIRSRQWALRAQAFHDNNNSRSASIVDFFEHVPRELEDPELRLPASTIPEPLGRTLRIFDDRTTRGQEPAEFALRTFLPGGFKIRYEGQLWMAPWNPVPGKPPSGNRLWVETASIVEAAPRNDFPEDLPTLLKNSRASKAKRQRLLEILTEDCRVIPVSGLKISSAGPGRNRAFQLDRETLQIHTRKPDNVPPSRLRKLVRDPHLTPRRFILVLEDDQEDPDGRDVPGHPLLVEALYHRQLRLVVGHWANLVHCYPDDGDVVTLSLNFWDRQTRKPVCVVAPQRAQAVEFLVQASVLEDSDWTAGSRERAFWRRVEDDLLDELVAEGRLESAYLVSGVVQVLKTIEIERHQRLGGFRDAPPDGAALEEGIQKVRAARGPLVQVYGRELEAVRTQSTAVAEILRSAVDWSMEQGPATVLGDSLVTGLTHLAAQKLRISPGSFRRLVEREGDELQVYLYDDFEGGGGNARRLAEELERWEGDLLDELAEAIRCPAAEADDFVRQVLSSPYSTDSLVAMCSAGALPFSSLDSRAVSRLERLLEAPDIAAFNRYAFHTYEQIRVDLGGEPPPLYFLSRVYHRPALDPRAEALRVRFSASPTPELPARLQEVAPLCVSGCPECLHSDRFERAYVDRGFLQRVLERLGGER